MEALASAGLDYAVMSRMGVEMPVVSLRVDYLRALRHGDWVTVESRCLPRSGVRWPWQCSLLVQQQVMARAEVDLVLLESGRVLRRPPEALTEVLRALQRGPQGATP